MTESRKTKSNFFLTMRLIKRFSDLLLASLVINILGLATPLVIMQAYDRIIPYRSYNTLVWLTFGATIAIIFETLLRYTRDQVSTKLGLNLENALYLKAFRKILRSTSQELEKVDIAVHIDCLKSIAKLKNHYFKSLIRFILDVPFSLLFLLTIFYLNAAIGIWVTAMAASILLCSWIMKKFYQDAKLQFNSADNDRISTAIEIISQIGFVKAFALEQKMVRRFEARQERIGESFYRQNIIAEIPASVNSLLSQLGIFGVLFVGAGDVIDNQLTVGTLTACMLLTGRVLSPVQSLASFNLQDSVAEINKKKVLSILMLSDYKDNREPRKAIETSISLDRVSYRQSGYDHGLFSELNLNISENSIIGITASNSTGSTTLLELIAGLIEPTSGAIKVGGIPSAFISTEDNPSLSYLPQNPRLFKGSIIENCSGFRVESYEEAVKIAKKTGLAKKVCELENGFSTQVSRESNRGISKNIIQLIYLNKVLTDDLPIILMDKPDQGMDNDSIAIFTRILKDLKSSKTILIVTDEKSILSVCDSIYKIKHGQILEVNKEAIVSETRESSLKMFG